MIHPTLKFTLTDMPLYVEVQLDKNKQIHDISPRTFDGIDLFSKYHGRTSDHIANLRKDILYICHNN